ncbi:ABC transporter substrate-binding protein [Paenibacillus sp. GCM10023252]|uniref:ABC transporter substrate-binding protein n=1 Tax=Paenibacillus sp. GCM10023252 TaxID=3252649 RepID=UPI00360BB732
MKKVRILILIALAAMMMSACQSSSSSKTDSGYPLEVKHLEGTTTVKAQPKKIITTSYIAAAQLLELGTAPYGTVDYSLLTNLRIYDEELNKGTIVDLGSPIDYEGIEKAAPDLILSLAGDGSDYDKLSGIAPTVVLESAQGQYSFDQMLLAVARIMNETDAAKAIIDKYANRLAEVKKTVQAKGAEGKTGVFLMATSKGNIVYGGSSVQSYLSAIGLTELPEWKEGGMADHEALAKHNPDFIFLAEDYVKPGNYSLDIQSNELWQGLKAVQSGQVYLMDAASALPLARGQWAGLDRLGKNLDMIP